MKVCHQWAAGTKATLTAIRNRKTNAEHRPGEVLEHPLDGAAEGQDQHDGEDQRVAIQAWRAPGRARPACGPSRPRTATPPRCRPGPASRAGRTRAGSRSPPRTAARAQPHDPAVDGLARVERVADAFEVEEDLQHDGDGRDQEDVGAVLDRGRGPHQPFAAADRRGGHDRARPDDLQGVAEPEGRRRRQLRDLPGGQRAVVRGQGARRPSATAWLSAAAEALIGAESTRMPAFVLSFVHRRC